MRRLLFLTLTAVAISACGGGGGSSGSPDPSPPVVVVNSVTPASFVPPATTTVDFTVTGQPIDGTSISVWMPTTGTTVRLLGELDLDVTSAGTVSKTWDGKIPMLTDWVATDNASIQLVQSNTPGNDVYSVRVHRTVLKWRQAGAGTLYTGTGIQDDLILYLSVDWTGGTVTLVDVTNLSGDGYSFPMSPGSYFDGVYTWFYEDHIKVYQYLLDTSNGSVSFAGPGVDMKWADVGMTLATAGSGSYRLGIVSFNAGGRGESALNTVAIP
ncbi:MAG: hypothetical protein HYY17_04920 [Planctomycetes bacterium]|nr:hypothetical protein [Planctomycetota bacterium]